MADTDPDAPAPAPPEHSPAPEIDDDPRGQATDADMARGDLQ
jgi:hypothetical protein